MKMEHLTDLRKNTISMVLLEEVSDAVKKAGLKIRNVYDAFSHNAPDDNSERLYYIIEK